MPACRKSKELLRISGGGSMATRRWQDWANLILGTWLFASPWVLDYMGTTPALNAQVMGAAILMFALIAAYMPQAWEEIINTLLGIWLAVSPFVLGFTALRMVALHTVVVGLLALAFAVWAMCSDQRLYKRWHSGHSA
jgi:hypothetical protein